MATASARSSGSGGGGGGGGGHHGAGGGGRKHNLGNVVMAATYATDAVSFGYLFHGTGVLFRVVLMVAWRESLSCQPPSQVFA